MTAITETPVTCANPDCDSTDFLGTVEARITEVPMKAVVWATDEYSAQDQEFVSLDAGILDSSVIFDVVCAQCKTPLSEDDE